MPTVILLRAGLRVLFRYLLCHSHGLHLRRPLRYFWQGSPGFFWGAIIWRAIIWRRKTANLGSHCGEMIALVRQMYHMVHMPAVELGSKLGQL
jgi:hypothetical protein